MKFKKILVTGSSGTIGTRLCEKLLEEGYEIVCVDARKNSWNTRINEFTTIADLRDPSAIENLPKDVDLVIHLAANARVYKLVKEPNLAMNNIETLFNILEFCRKNSIKNFIFSSSREVYGNSDRQVFSEIDAHIENCESPYTASKIAGEALVSSYFQCFEINFIILRFSNVYGMYDDSDRVVPLFIRLTKQGEDLVVYGKEKTLDFTYIDDTVSGVLKCMEKFDEIKNDTINIASGKGVAITNVAEIIRKLMGGQNKIVIKENRTGEVLKCVVGISKAKEKLGYQPNVEIEEGLKKSVEWYTKNKIF